jgi:hypothetical protein
MSQCSCTFLIYRFLTWAGRRNEKAVPRRFVPTKIVPRTFKKPHLTQSLLFVDAAVFPEADPIHQTGFQVKNDCLSH